MLNSTERANKNREQRRDHAICIEIVVSVAWWGRNQKASLYDGGNCLLEREQLVIQERADRG